MGHLVLGRTTFGQTTSARIPVVQASKINPQSTFAKLKNSELFKGVLVVFTSTALQPEVTLGKEWVKNRSSVSSPRNLL